MARWAKKPRLNPQCSDRDVHRYRYEPLLSTVENARFKTMYRATESCVTHNIRIVFPFRISLHLYSLDEVLCTPYGCWYDTLCASWCSSIFCTWTNIFVLFSEVRIKARKLGQWLLQLPKGLTSSAGMCHSFRKQWRWAGRTANNNRVTLHWCLSEQLSPSFSLSHTHQCSCFSSSAKTRDASLLPKIIPSESSFSSFSRLPNLETIQCN